MGLKSQLEQAATQDLTGKDLTADINARYFRPIAEELATLGLYIRHALGTSGHGAYSEIQIDLAPFTPENADVFNGDSEWTHDTPRARASLSAKGSTGYGTRQIRFASYFKLSGDTPEIESGVTSKQTDPQFSKCHGDHNLHFKDEQTLPVHTSEPFPQSIAALQFFLTDREYQKLLADYEALSETPEFQAAVQEIVDTAEKRYVGVKIQQLSSYAPADEQGAESAAATGGPLAGGMTAG